MRETLTPVPADAPAYIEKSLDPRVDQALMAVGGRAREPQRQRLPPARVQTRFRCRAYLRRTPRIRDHQSRSLGNLVLWEIGWNGEEESVAESLVLRPFGVTLQIGDRDLHLDDRHAAVRAQRDHVGPAPVRERELRQYGITKVDKVPAYATRRLSG